MLLTSTTSKSIIVIEDIDCSLDLTGTRQQQKPKQGSSSHISSSVTLSGLLNFSDGLWSCCGNERIIVFTTNHIEKLDPGLLRPGRMDMHLHMSFCNFDIFKVLAMNYLSVSNHPIFAKIEEALQEENVCITPAEVTEFLFQHKNDPELALKSLVEDLERRTVEGDAVVIGEGAYRDSSYVDSVEGEGVVEGEEGAGIGEEGEKPCSRIHCNVGAHKSQGEMLKMHMNQNQRLQQRRGGGARRGSRSSRY